MTGAQALNIQLVSFNKSNASRPMLSSVGLVKIGGFVFNTSMEHKNGRQQAQTDTHHGKNTSHTFKTLLTSSSRDYYFGFFLIFSFYNFGCMRFVQIFPTSLLVFSLSLRLLR
jgi:hypothetical protein